MNINEEIQFKINLIAVLEDIQEQLLLELPNDYRHGMKQWLNKCRVATKKFIKECDKILSEVGQEGLGESADNLRKIIENELRKFNDIG